jgi:hypothetical protein
MGTARSKVRAGTRRSRGIYGVLLAVLLTLIVAAPAMAESATATLAPIGTGSYVLTVTNTSSETLGGFVFTAGEKPTNIVPSSACKFGNTPVAESINCTISIAPGASVEMCYTGLAVTEALPGKPATILLDSAASNPYISAVTVAAVSSCPVPGFSAGSGSGGGGSSAKCVVPNVKGKSLASAESAITKAHCTVGNVKRARSSHVKKGKVVSQGAAVGRSLSSGAKVSLVVSKGS